MDIAKSMAFPPPEKLIKLLAPFDPRVSGLIRSMRWPRNNWVRRFHKTLGMVATAVDSLL